MNTKQKEEYIRAMDRVINISGDDLNFVYSADDVKTTVFNLVDFIKEINLKFYKKNPKKEFENFKNYVKLNVSDYEHREYIVKKFLKFQKQVKKIRSAIKRCRT